jgi:hypothetical protein
MWANKGVSVVYDPKVYICTYSYIKLSPVTLLPVLAGEDLIFQWIGLVEYIPYYGAQAVHCQYASQQENT